MSGAKVSRDGDGGVLGWCIGAARAARASGWGKGGLVAIRVMVEAYGLSKGAETAYLSVISMEGGALDGDCCRL